MIDSQGFRDVIVQQAETIATLREALEHISAAGTSRDNGWYFHEFAVKALGYNPAHVEFMKQSALDLKISPEAIDDLRDDIRRWPCGAPMDPDERDGEPDTDYCPDCEKDLCVYGDEVAKYDAALKKLS